MRTITSVEELDALPTRSVVLDKHGRAWQIRHRWDCNDSKMNPIYLSTDLAHVSLLHEPGKEPRLPGPGDGCQCTGYSQDAGGGYFEHIDRLAHSKDVRVYGDYGAGWRDGVKAAAGLLARPTPARQVEGGTDE